MKRCASALALLCLAACAASAQDVRELARLTREQAALHQPCVTTGVVTGVFVRHKRTAVIADPSDPNGYGVYIAYDSPRSPSSHFASKVFSVGDVVELHGHVSPFMLAPGLMVDSFVKLGRMELPDPETCRLADLAAGAYLNRRVRLRGVLWNVRIEHSGNRPVTLLSIGTPDGVLSAMVDGDYHRFIEFRDCEVMVDGFIASQFNARAEFLRPQIELLNGDSLRVLRPAPRPITVLPPSSGVLGWTPEGVDCHLRLLRGEVTYVDADEKFFILQDRNATRVDVMASVEGMPKVGDYVEADGFPVMMDECGVLDAAQFRVLEEGVFREEPYEPNAAELTQLAYDVLSRRDDYLLMRITGRLESYSARSSGDSHLSVIAHEQQLNVFVDELIPDDIVRSFEDRPMVTVTGVYRGKTLGDWNFSNSYLGPGKLFLRSIADIEVVPDVESRQRGLVRVAHNIILWAMLPVVLAVLHFVVVTVRRHELEKAVDADRKRMAEQLHDTLMQHLSGARLLLFSVQGHADNLPEDARNALMMAGDVLESARRETRDAVLNLQSDEMTTLAPAELLERAAKKTGRALSIEVRCRLNGVPVQMPLSEKTDLVCIVQEAITNAVKHGRASELLLVAEPLQPSGFALSVLNDGAPFDAKRVLGVESGHFGLSSMRERARRSGFVITFGRRGGYTEVRLERRR